MLLCVCACVCTCARMFGSMQFYRTCRIIRPLPPTCTRVPPRRPPATRTATPLPSLSPASGVTRASKGSGSPGPQRPRACVSAQGGRSVSVGTLTAPFLRAVTAGTSGELRVWTAAPGTVGHGSSLGLCFLDRAALICSSQRPRLLSCLSRCPLICTVARLFPAPHPGLLTRCHPVLEPFPT